jgi:hypothetical protein
MSEIQISESVGKKNILFYLVVAYLALTYWMLFDSAFAGIKLTKGSDISSGLITNVLAYCYVWKRLGRKPLVGALIGVLVFILLTLVATVVAIKVNGVVS